MTICLCQVGTSFRISVADDWYDVKEAPPRVAIFLLNPGGPTY